MIRIAHKLLTRNIKLEPGGDTVGLQARCNELIEDLESHRAPIIIADNVEDHWAKVNRLPVNLNQACLMPPFQSFFIECMVDIGQGTKMPFGWWFNQRDGFVEGVMAHAPKGMVDLVMNHPRDRRLTGTLVLIQPQNGVPRYVEQGVTVLLDEEGIKQQLLVFSYGYKPLDPEQITGIFPVPLMTLAFMNCSNSMRVDVTDQEAPPRKWVKRLRVADLKYQAVLIDPNLESVRPGERKTEGDRSGKSLHICRGHFAHYKNDGVSKGLFGKGIYGFFWIPAHIRGSSDQGTVVSTYKVKPKT